MFTLKTAADSLNLSAKLSKIEFPNRDRLLITNSEDSLGLAYGLSPSDDIGEFEPSLNPLSIVASIVTEP